MRRPAQPGISWDAAGSSELPKNSRGVQSRRYRCAESRGPNNPEPARADRDLPNFEFHHYKRAQAIGAEDVNPSGIIPQVDGNLGVDGFGQPFPERGGESRQEQATRATFPPEACNRDAAYRGCLLSDNTESPGRGRCRLSKLSSVSSVRTGPTPKKIRSRSAPITRAKSSPAEPQRIIILKSRIPANEIGGQIQHFFEQRTPAERTQHRPAEILFFFGNAGNRRTANFRKVRVSFFIFPYRHLCPVMVQVLASMHESIGGARGDQDVNHRKASRPLFGSQRRKPEQSLADRQMRVFTDIHIRGNQKAILPPIAKHDAEKRSGEAAGQIGSLAGPHDLMRREFASEPIANGYPQLMRIRGSIRRCIFPCNFKCFRYRAPGTGEEQAQAPWFWLRGGNPETRPTPLPSKTKADLIPLYPPPRIHGYSTIPNPLTATGRARHCHWPSSQPTPTAPDFSADAPPPSFSLWHFPPK